MLAAVTLTPNPNEDRPRDLPHVPPVPPLPPADGPRDLSPPSGPPADAPAPPPSSPYAGSYGSDTGTNGFAIAALVCGLAFFVPLAAVLGIVFGIIALRQIAKTLQRGRGMAIAGIVSGSLVVLAWIGLLTFVVTAAPSLTSAGPTPTSGTAFVDELQPGDCFSGLTEGSTEPVTVHPCTDAHQAQLVASTTREEVDFPGADETAALAVQRCEVVVEPLIRDDVTEELDLYYYAPETSLDWRLDRSVQCVLAAIDGQMTGSLLR